MWHPQEGLEGGSRELQIYQPDFDAMKDYGKVALSTILQHMQDN